jgi:uncharacterized protein (DUF362 family)
MLASTPVALYDAGTTGYPREPFNPSENYPEYPFGARGFLSNEENRVYASVRAMLRDLGFDAARYGTPDWNPLGELVQPGATVVLKPNLVLSEHALGQPGIEATVAHGAVLRPLIDYAFIALQGRGRILVADSPLKEVDFDRILTLSGVRTIVDFYNRWASIPVEALDFRDRYVARNEFRFMTDLTSLLGDPAGYSLVDLGAESMFHDAGIAWQRLRSTAVYYENVMGEFHNDAHHKYSIPNTLLGADLVISVAKLKTHRKSGVTLSLKNAVGITNEKRALPHHRVGSPSRGGDAVADGARPDAWLEDSFRDVMLSHRYGRHVLKVVGPPLRVSGRRVLRNLFSRLRPGLPPEATIVEGDWFGNDTVWRMALDLNRVLIYADRDGRLAAQPQRKYLSIIDGIVAGEGEGPLYPDPVKAGILLAGLHPVTVDVVAGTVMGYDYRKIAILREAVERQWPLRPEVAPADIQIVGNRPEWRDMLRDGPSPFAFRASAGWQGHIERAAGAHSTAVGVR